MFTGIITDMGSVRAINKGGNCRYEFNTSYNTNEISIGASISCSGTCLTVIAKGDDWFAVDVSEETLSKTTLGYWTQGTPVNFERPLRMQEEFGGHIVCGHVDGIGTIVSAKREKDSLRLGIVAPKELCRYIAPKGSISVNGVSLTVNEVSGDVFAANIIPHTLDTTTFGASKIDDRVNLEIDILSRYVARLLEKD